MEHKICIHGMVKDRSLRFYGKRKKIVEFGKIWSITRKTLK